MVKKIYQFILISILIIFPIYLFSNPMNSNKLSYSTKVNDYVLKDVVVGGGSIYLIVEENGNNNVYVYGNNTYGQLGINSQSDYVYTLEQVNVNGYNVKQVEASAGTAIIWAEDENGTDYVYVMGHFDSNDDDGVDNNIYVATDANWDTSIQISSLASLPTDSVGNNYSYGVFGVIAEGTLYYISNGDWRDPNGHDNGFYFDTNGKWVEITAFSDKGEQVESAFLQCWMGMVETVDENGEHHLYEFGNISSNIDGGGNNSNSTYTSDIDGKVNSVRYVEVNLDSSLSEKSTINDIYTYESNADGGFALINWSDENNESVNTLMGWGFNTSYLIDENVSSNKSYSSPVEINTTGIPEDEIIINFYKIGNSRMFVETIDTTGNEHLYFQGSSAYGLSGNNNDGNSSEKIMYTEFIPAQTNDGNNISGNIYAFDFSTNKSESAYLIYEDTDGSRTLYTWGQNSLFTAEEQEQISSGPEKKELLSDDSQNVNTTNLIINLDYVFSYGFAFQINYYNDGNNILYDDGYYLHLYTEDGNFDSEVTVVEIKDDGNGTKTYLVYGLIPGETYSSSTLDPSAEHLYAGYSFGASGNVEQMKEVEFVDNDGIPTSVTLDEAYVDVVDDKINISSSSITPYSFEFEITIREQETGTFIPDNLEIYADYNGNSHQSLNCTYTGVSSDDGNGNITYTYSVDGLNPNTEYSNFYVSLTGNEDENQPVDIYIDGIASESIKTTSDSPQIIYMTTSNVTYDSFEFTLTIDDTFNVFGSDPLDSYQADEIEVFADVTYTNGETFTSELNVQYISDDGTDYTYEAFGLEAGATYSNFNICLTGDNDDWIEIPNVSVTTNSYEIGIIQGSIEVLEVTNNSFKISFTTDSSSFVPENVTFYYTETEELNYTESDLIQFTNVTYISSESDPASNTYVYEISNLTPDTDYYNININFNVNGGEYQKLTINEGSYYIPLSIHTNSEEPLIVNDQIVIDTTSIDTNNLEFTFTIEIYDEYDVFNPNDLRMWANGDELTLEYVGEEPGTTAPRAAGETTIYTYKVTDGLTYNTFYDFDSFSVSTYDGYTQSVNAVDVNGQIVSFTTPISEAATVTIWIIVTTIIILLIILAVVIGLIIWKRHKDRKMAQAINNW